MPYVCTHLAFGDRVLKALGSSVDQLGDAYLLGCLGPDIYFFDRLPPTPFIPHQKKHGNALHETDAAALFSALRSAAPDALRPYLIGLLTHIALDGTLHPYIEARHTGLDHTRFEGVIDAAVYAETKDRLPYREWLFARRDTDDIDVLLSDVSLSLFGKDVRGAYRRSARKFRRLVPFLFDPNGQRYRFLCRAERLFRKEGLLSAFLLAAPRADAEDAFNLARAPWAAPWAPDCVRNDSVPMLFDEAEALACRLIRAFSENDAETLSALLTNRTMQKGALP